MTQTPIFTALDAEFRAHGVDIAKIRTRPSWDLAEAKKRIELQLKQKSRKPATKVQKKGRNA